MGIPDDIEMWARGPDEDDSLEHDPYHIHDFAQEPLSVLVDYWEAGGTRVWSCPDDRFGCVRAVVRFPDERYRFISYRPWRPCNPEGDPGWIWRATNRQETYELTTVIRWITTWQAYVMRFK